MNLDTSSHPCFNDAVRHKYARIHLPVAPECNIQCNFCDRRFDCANESRPGVTSAVLTPGQALYYLKKMVAADPNIRVVGIAGPGEPFANAAKTLRTIGLIRQAFPQMLICVASNGLELAQYANSLAGFKVSHVTITINAVDPHIGGGIYAWIRRGTRIYRGMEAGLTLLSRQLEAIRTCKEHGLTVKINTIVIPGINDQHIIEVARTVSYLGADIMNCIGIYSVPSTAFEAILPPTEDAMVKVRAEVSKYMPQMHHCTRCRADAVGLLGKGISERTVSLLRSIASGPIDPEENRPYVAVTSHEGMLVNQHLGEATNILIFGRDESGTIKLVETRAAPAPGGGAKRWLALAGVCSDCRVLLTLEAGQSPTSNLAVAGLKVIQTDGIIAHVVDDIFNGLTVHSVPSRGCGHGCSGTGMGCS